MVHYALPDISYGYDELEPFVDEQTMRLHHLQFHKSYVDGLNHTLVRIGGDRHPQHISSILSDLSSVPKSERDFIVFFGGGFENHRMLWESMMPPQTSSLASSSSASLASSSSASLASSSSSASSHHVSAPSINHNSNGGDKDIENDHQGRDANNHNEYDLPNLIMPKPGGILEDAVDIYFGGFKSFQDEFTDKAASIQGSGWCWLVLDPSYNRLEITVTANNDSPWMLKRIPLLGLDLWEHAYYLKYQNDRLRYVKMWWHIINWQNVERKFVLNSA